MDFQQAYLQAQEVYKDALQGELLALARKLLRTEVNVFFCHHASHQYRLNADLLWKSRQLSKARLFICVAGMQGDEVNLQAMVERIRDCAQQLWCLATVQADGSLGVGLTLIGSIMKVTILGVHPEEKLESYKDFGSLELYIPEEEEVAVPRYVMQLLQEGCGI